MQGEGLFGEPGFAALLFLLFHVGGIKCTLLLSKSQIYKSVKFKMVRCKAEI